MASLKCLDRFVAKMERDGGSLRNENINNSKQLLEATFADDAACAIGIYFWELGLKRTDKGKIL